MAVNRAQHFVPRQPGAPAFLSTLGAALAVIVLCSGAGASIHAQAPNPTSAANPFFGSVTAHPVSDETLKLSLDEAVRRGLENNLGLKEAENGEKALHGEKNVALQEFLPTIALVGDTGAHQQNLAALGFGPGVIKDFAPLANLNDLVFTGWDIFEAAWCPQASPKSRATPSPRGRSNLARCSSPAR